MAGPTGRKTLLVWLRPPLPEPFLFLAWARKCESHIHRTPGFWEQSWGDQGGITARLRHCPRTCLQGEWGGGHRNTSKHPGI